MKKTLAIILTIVMLVCSIPFAVSAAEGDYTVSGNFSGSNEIESNSTRRIVSGVTMSAPANFTLYIPAGATLIVQEGAKLNVSGSIVVLPGGKLEVYGQLMGATNVSVNEGASAVAQVRFDSLANYGLDGRVNVKFATSTNGDAYEDTKIPDDQFTTVNSVGGSYMVPLKQFLYIKAELIEPDPQFDKFDDSKLTVGFNQIPLTFKQGTHNVMVTTAGDISYSRWTNESDYLNTFSIYLPTGEGYTVYGREGEQSALGETVKLKYGSSFAFKVEIEPEYDMSSYEVYIYSGYGWTNLDTSTVLKDLEPAQPDQYGYYYIPEVKGEHTVYVVGVVKNETILMIADIFDMIKNVFNMIAEFFKQIAEFFGFNPGA